MGSSVNVAGDHVMKVSFDVVNRRLCLAFDSLNSACFATDYTGGLMGVRTDRLWLVKVKGAAFESREKALMDRKRLESGNYTLLALKKGLNTTFNLILGNSSINYINYSGNQSLLRYSIEFVREILTKQEDKNIYFNLENYHNEISYANIGASKVILNNVSVASPSIILIPSDPPRPCISFDRLGANNNQYIVIMSSPESPLKIFSEFIALKFGLGFYTVAEMNKLHVVGDKFFLYFSNGSSLQLGGNITLEGRFFALARRPVFIAEQAVVKQVIGQSLLYPYVTRDLLIRGRATFRFVTGDSSLQYFIVDITKAKVSFEQPLDIYSEWESAPLFWKHLPLSIALTALVLCSVKLPKFLERCRKV
jgi:hypothetical protein